MECRFYHVAFVVRDLDAGLALWRALGFEGSASKEDPVDGFRWSNVDLRGVSIMLMAPTDPDGPVGRFLARHGEGFHHLAIETPDCRATVDELRRRGTAFFGAEPREQSYEIAAFAKPTSTHGILLEIVQPK